jgi:hypothetical protein
VLLILGSAFDDEPWRLADRWPGRDALVVMPSDLSRPGWRLRRGQPAHTRAAVGDRLLRADEFDAVVSMLPWVGLHDLPHVAEHDRAYVAGEMSAFLLAWLQELECPVLDRPTPLSLAGCGRWTAEWATLARSVGVAGETGWTGPTIEVTVVGGRAIADHAAADPARCRAAEVIAAAAGRTLVTLQFKPHGGEPVLVGSTARPAAGSQAAADALQGLLESR